MKTVTYYEMEYPEFDKLVSETLGIDYESVAENEWNNDSSYDFKGIKKEPLDEYDAKRIALHQQGSRTYNLWAYIVLRELVNRDVLPEGDYIIQVCW